MSLFTNWRPGSSGQNDWLAAVATIDFESSSWTGMIAGTLAAKLGRTLDISVDRFVRLSNDGLCKGRGGCS